MPDWGEVLKEIHGQSAFHFDQVQQLQQQAQQHQQLAASALDLVRRKYLNALHQATGRNVIAYYSGFLSKPGIAQIEITDEDKNGFMMAVHTIGADRHLGLDLILHTPGGSIAATESIVDYLHQIFGSNIRAIIPQIAMSAGTMTACSCSNIIMARHSNLGPIDPHLNGFPAYGVREEFKRAVKEVKKDPSSIPIWQSIIARYGPTFLSQCENAITWSKDFVESQLENVMFAGEPNAPQKAKSIVKKLADYRGNKTHARHIHFDELKKMGLKVERLEDDQNLQDLVLTVHHCFMHSLMNTAAFKIIENHKGSAFVKQQMQVQVEASK